MNHETKSNECLSCHKKLDMATGINTDNAPKEGTITICMYCGHLMAFAHDLSFRNLTDKEMYDLAGHPEILRVQAARHEVMKDYDKWKEQLQ